MRSQALDFFLLKLRVPFDFASGCINKCSRVTKISSKKKLEIYLEQGFYLSLIFVLVLVETDLFTKKNGGKYGTI